MIIARPLPRAARLARWALALLLSAATVQVLAPSPANADSACTFDPAHPLECVLIWSDLGSYVLQPDDARTDDGTPVMIPGQTDGTPTEQWRLRFNDDGSFFVINIGAGRCLDSSSSPVQIKTCTYGDEQKWFAEPAPEGGPGNVYLRPVKSPGNCLDVLHSENYVGTWGCTWQRNERFFVGPGTIPDPFNANDHYTVDALQARITDYWSQKCSGSSSTCDWQATSEGDAETVADKCLVPAVFNNSDGNLTRNVTTTKTTGWTVNVGYSVTTKLTTGDLPGLIAKIEVSSTYSFGVSANASGAVADSVSFTTAPQKWSWFALSYNVRPVTGKFTFDQGGHPFTVDATVRIPVQGTSASAAESTTAQPTGCP